MPSRGLGAAHAVTSTMVSPERTMTEPSACLARRPVSIDRACLPMLMLRVCIVLSLMTAMVKLTAGGHRTAHFSALVRAADAKNARLSCRACRRDLLANAKAPDQFGVALGVL